MRIAILGVGLIGGSIGLAAHERLTDAEVVGYDPRREVLDAALERGAIDRAAGSVADAVTGASVAIACAPVGALPELVRDTLSAAPGDCVVSDVGSVKRLVAAATADQRFIGGHPLAGAESAGVENARADLFDGAPWYLTPGPESSGLLLDRLNGVLVDIGARPAAIDPETHDRLLATVSHLPHVIANVLVSQAARALSDEGEGMPRVGPSFRDATRVAGANPGIWTDIYISNGEAIARQIDAAAERLREVAASLRAGDAAAIESWNEGAAGDRRRLLEADLAGGEVHELRLSVPNRPGIVARVALALGKAGVNIVDMALSPAPDMRSGQIALWVAGDEPADRAEELIGELGFPVTRAS
ncbi:MAG: prephenate dehydrogenase/arogenate dehydrogenase family protein [Thermoleophilaceae bacterium]